ncbi:MAG: ATP-dependent zinc metalloprotease FtsH [Anaerolineae bacterium]|nr:ATP-dependent zinc metalloprotease FtsH [Anaerolineae bacterium]
MNAAETNQTLDHLIRAGRSLIGVISNDEYRVLRGLDAVCHFDKQRHPKSGEPRKLYHWDVFAGFQTWREGDSLPDELVNKQGGKGLPITDPTMAIRAMLALPAAEEALFVLKGLEMLLANNPLLQRGLRNLNMALKQRQQAVILLSPALNLPPGLATEVSVVDYPLPDLAEINATLDAIGQKAGVTVNLNNGQADRQALANALRGLELEDMMAVLHQSLVRFRGEINAETINLVLDEKQRIVKRTGALQFVRSGETMADIGGLANLKRYLDEIQLTFTDKARERRVDVARGVLIAGIPGTGKSLAAKACAGGRHPRPLLRMSISELMAQGGGIVGQAQGRVHLAIKVIEATAPCVLWIDEIEKSLGGGGGELDGGTRSDIMADLLTWMQESTAPVFIVATANDATALRPELVRRFDETFFVDVPGPTARREIFSLHLGKRALAPADFDLARLVEAARGYTGAEIEKAVIRATRKALVREEAGAEYRVTTDDVLAALGEITPVAASMADRLALYRQFDARPADSDDPEAGQPGYETAVENQAVRW